LPVQVLAGDARVTRVLTGAVRAALRELSDGDYQSRAWTGRDARGEMSSLDEAVCGLYDDSGLGDALERGEEVFGSAIDADLRSLGNLLSRIDGALDPSATIADPKMRAVREQAAAILRALEADEAAQ
jgi:hypothetical protein